MKIKFKPELDRKHQTKMTTITPGQYFETASGDYDVIRRARTNMGKNPKYEHMRWSLKLGKGILTVKRLEDEELS